MAQNGDLLFGAEAGGGGPVAQLVEHRTFNAVVPGSSPGRLTTYRKMRSTLRSSRISNVPARVSDLA
jgi:hypothetical protein